MNQEIGQPGADEPHQDLDQVARARDRARAYQAARDQQITEINVYLPTTADQDGSVNRSVILREISVAKSEAASAQDTVTSVQESVSRHHSLIDFLYQMLRNVQQAVDKLTAERDNLREELRSRANLDAKLAEIQSSLEDRKHRLEEAERVQSETARRLAEAQHQRAEAERLRTEALEQLSRTASRLADLERSAFSSAAEPTEESQEPNESSPSLMGETDQQVSTEILDRVDDVLKQEADNLSHLRDIITESDSRDNDRVHQTRTPSGRPQSDDIPRNPEPSSPEVRVFSLTALGSAPDIDDYDFRQLPPRSTPRTPASPGAAKPPAAMRSPAATSRPQPARSEELDLGALFFALCFVGTTQYMVLNAVAVAFTSTIFQVGHLGLGNYSAFIGVIVVLGLFSGFVSFVIAYETINLSNRVFGTLFIFFIWFLGVIVGIYRIDIPILGHLAFLFSNWSFFRF